MTHSQQLDCHHWRHGTGNAAHGLNAHNVEKDELRPTEDELILILEDLIKLVV